MSNTQIQRNTLLNSGLYDSSDVPEPTNISVDVDNQQIGLSPSTRRQQERLSETAR